MSGSVTQSTLPCPNKEERGRRSVVGGSIGVCCIYFIYAWEKVSRRLYVALAGTRIYCGNGRVFLNAALESFFFKSLSYFVLVMVISAESVFKNLGAYSI